MLPWDPDAEVTFECEPGTLTEGKLQVIGDLGVTRLSLGIENFNDAILKANGRAHLSKEIDRAYNFARSIGFPQINIDLIAGMVGETDDNWRDCVEKTIALAPDSVTIYQMEVPYNTTLFQEMKVYGHSTACRSEAGWKTNAVESIEAFAGSGKTTGYGRAPYRGGKDSAKTRFMYRDMLWAGADMLGLGVASFSHIQGVHFQNQHEFEPYIEKLRQGELPIYRALAPTSEERMIRELILQMKLGRVRSVFPGQVGVDLERRFAGSL